MTGASRRRQAGQHDWQEVGGTRLGFDDRAVSLFGASRIEAVVVRVEGDARTRRGLCCQPHDPCIWADFCCKCRREGSVTGGAERGAEQGRGAR